ncbi:MAG: hypothetical protein AAF542_24010 [Pseudomonadota bacterium]
MDASASGPKLLLDAPKLRFLSLLTLAVLLFAYFNYVSGVRGQDQYWYLADTETLINNGTPTTNFVFPGMVLRQQTGNPETFFVHNGPLLTLTAAIAKTLNVSATTAWKLSNFGLLFFSAVLTGLVCARLANSTWGWAAFLLYLIAPINVWQAGNFLQELYLGFLTAAMLMMLFLARNRLIWLMPPLAFVAVLSHPFFLVASLLFIAFTILVQRQVLLGLATLLAVASALALKSSLYPSSFQPDLLSIVASAAPGKSNMIWHLSDQLPELSFGLMLSKFTDAVHLQFLDVSMLPFTFVTNIGLIALLWLAFTNFQANKPLVIICALCYLTYFAMVVLMQNQPRYQMLISPIVVCAIAVAASGLEWRRWAEGLLIAGLAGVIAADAYLLSTVDRDAQSEAAVIERFKQQLAGFNKSDRIAFVATDVQAVVPLLAAMTPAKCLLLDLDYLPTSKVNESLQLFQPDLIVSSSLPDDSMQQHRVISEFNAAPLTVRLYIYESSGTHKI